MEVHIPDAVLQVGQWIINSTRPEGWPSSPMSVSGLLADLLSFDFQSKSFFRLGHWQNGKMQCW
jgi:hypothetical protein